jgi:hypothetical protein
MHLDEFGGRSMPPKKKKSGQKSGQTCGHKVTMDQLSDACSVLIQHVIDMNSDTAVLTIQSTNSGTAKITVEIIDEGDED